MSTEHTDPRAQLASSGAPRVVGANVEPQYLEFSLMDPTITTQAGGRQWWVRSQALVIAYLDLMAADLVVIDDQPDEYMVIVSEGGGSVSFRAGDMTAEAAPGSLVVVPPGVSSFQTATGAAVVGVFSSQSETLSGRCANAEFYSDPDPNVAPWKPWPGASDGAALRVYDVVGVKPERGRFGRIYRCSTVMVNWLHPDPGPRDPARLSPHHHDDFEQVSLQLAGDYVHHIRTPWTTDLANWRDDDHHHTTSPSVTVIPPPSVHTSQGVGETEHQLIDIFAPPRFDFSSKEGWILNADDYPMPSTVNQPES
jgi:hypothetical protein